VIVLVVKYYGKGQMHAGQVTREFKNVLKSLNTAEDLHNSGRAFEDVEVGLEKSRQVTLALIARPGKH
jgi:hypothetical protein